MGKTSNGKLSPDGSDFATENKGTETFKKQLVDEQLAKRPLTADALAQSFTTKEIVPDPIQVQPDQPSDITHTADLAEVGSIIPKPTLTKYETPGTLAPNEEIIPEQVKEEPLSVIPSDTYVLELATLAKRIGLQDKYSSDLIKANITNKEFVNDLVSKLEQDPSTYDEAVNLKDTKRQRLRNELFGRTGHDYNNATTEQLEKELESQHSYENQTKQFLKDPKASFATVVEQGEIMTKMAESYQKGTEVAFDFFKNNVQNNPNINEWYKGLAANSIHELMKKDAPSAYTAAYSPEYKQMLDEYVKRGQELTKFQLDNKNGFEAGQVEQVRKFDLIQKNLAPLAANAFDIADAKLTAERSNSVDLGSWDLEPSMPKADEKSQGMKEAVKEKDLARNTQIMLNDIQRLVNQFHNPNILGGFTKSDEVSQTLSESSIGAFDALGEFIPGQLPVGIAQGIKHPLWDMDLLTSLIPIIEKEQKGEKLTDTEQLALVAYGTLTTANQNIPKTFAFELGTGIPKNIEFMAEMAISYGVYNWAAKGLEKLAEKELRTIVQSKATGAIAKTLANATKKWVPELIGMVGGNLAILPAQPAGWNEYMVNKVGQVNLKDFDQLSLGVEGKFQMPEVDVSQALKIDKAKAAWDAGRHTFSEYFSEATGPIIEMGINALGRKIGIKKIFSGKKFAWQRAAKLDSFFGENAEEWLGAGLNWVTGDTNEQLAQQFTPRSLLMIAASVGVFTGPVAAAQQYKSWQYNKGMQVLEGKGLETLGKDKWEIYQDGLKNNVTLNSRSKFVNEFISTNALDDKQANFAGMYAGARTAGEIANGAIEARGKNTGLVTNKSLADLKLQNKLDRKAKLIDLVEANLKTEYETLLEKYKDTVSDPNTSNKQAKRDLRADFKKLLTNPSIVSDVEQINKEFAKLVEDASIQDQVAEITAEYEQKANALITPREMSDGQFAIDEMDLAVQQQMKESYQKEQDLTSDMRSEQVDARYKELNGLVGTALSPEERITDIAEIITKNKESKLLKPKEIKGLLSLKTQLSSLSQQEFNELKHRRDFAKQQLANVLKQERRAEQAKQRRTMLSGFTDEQGNVREDISHSSLIEEAYAAEEEYNNTPVISRDSNAIIKKYSEAVTRIRSAFDVSLNDKPGVQIEEINEGSVKVGTKVILQHNRLGGKRSLLHIPGVVKSVNTKNGTALVEITSNSGERSEILINPNLGETGNWKMFENQNKENNSVYRGREASTFVRGTIIYFKNKAKFEEYQNKRKGFDGKTMYFNSESEANNKLQEFNDYWDTADLAYVYKPKDSKKWIVKTRKTEYASEELKAEIIAERKAKEVNQRIIEISRPENDLFDPKLTDEQRSAIALGMQDEIDLDEYLDQIYGIAKEREFESNQKINTEGLNNEYQRTKVLKVLKRLSRGLGITFTVVHEDKKYPERPRAGWQIGNKYYVNDSVARGDTPIHEYAHPIIDAIETEFPELFSNLYKELEATNDPRLEKIIEDVQRLYPKLTKQQKQKESIVTAIGLIGEMQLNVDLSLFAQIMYRIGNAISNFIQQVLGRGGIKIDTTMEELSQKILTGRVSVGKRAESTVEQNQNVNPKFSGNMTFSYGQNKRSDIKSESTFEAIKNGERTATTRYESDGHLDYWAKAQIGDIIEWKSKDGEKVQVEVTKPLHKLTPDTFAEEWSKLEGWSTEYFEKQVKPKLSQAWQIEYKVPDKTEIKIDKTVVPKQETIETVTPSEIPIQKSGYLSIDKAMTVSFDEFYTMIDENEDGELSKWDIINKAVYAGAKEFKKSDMYLKMLNNSQRKMNVDLFENMMQKILRKKKDAFDEDGKQATMDNYEGVGATAEDKMNQFRSPFSKALYSMATKTELTKDLVEKNLVDMFTDPKFHVKKKVDYENLAFRFTDQNHINIANALNDVLTYEQFLSLQHFYGSIHFEEQYAIQINEDTSDDSNAPKVSRAVIEKQSIVSGNLKLREAFEQYVDGLSSVDMQKILMEYNSFVLYNENRYNGNAGYAKKNFTITQEYIDRTKRLLKSLTGFDDAIIDAYLDNPRILDAAAYYWENEKFNKITYGSTLKSLIGKEIRFKNKDSEYKPIQAIQLVSTLISNVKNANNQLSIKLIKDLMNSKKGGYSNVDTMLTSYARSSGKIGMSGTDVKGDRFSTMSLAHQIYNQSKKLGDILTNAILKAYYTANPMKIQKFNGFYNNVTDKSFSGTKIDGESLQFALVFMFHTAGVEEYQHFLGQFSDKTVVYTGNAPKWDSEKYWDRASAVNVNLQKDVDSLIPVIKKFASELAFDTTDIDGMIKLAKDFMVSFTANSNVLLPIFHGKKSDFKNKKTGEFDFADMIKRAQVVISPGYQIVTDVEGGIPDQIRYVVANDVIIKSLAGKDNERLDGLNFMSEDFALKAETSMGEFFARKKEFGGVDMLKAVVTGVNDNRLLIKSNIVNIGMLKGLYGPDDIHTKIADYMRLNHIDVLSFPSSAKKYDKSKTTTLFDKVTGAFVNNTPNPIMVNRSDFYIQQDLRHSNKPSPYDLPNQLYSNIVTLDSFQDIIEQISIISSASHNFINQFFSGFKNEQAIQQYLLYNLDEEKDGPEFKTLLEAWAINDPGFRTKVISKLVNLVNRDVLELAVPRQSSIEIPDIEGRLLRLRRGEGGNILLPEIGLNVPGLRYAIDTFSSKEEAYFWMDKNDDKLVDLKDKETGKLQLWQVYQDPKTNLWVVPGEPVLSTRVPAGDLHSHTIARARYYINPINSKGTALTMLDMESQIASGSDNDGDARYNWVLSSEQGYIITDGSFKGRVNNILFTLMDEYQSEKNFEKITNPINTEVFDDIIKDIMVDYSNTNGIDENEMVSLSAQGLSRSRNMTGYNLKGIMSNLTSSFSYLKAFGVEKVIDDQYNTVKAAIENILNLAFDNAKDPKIEKLGINEATAVMFIYELITDKSTDQATSRDAALLLTEDKVRVLAMRYSPYSSTQDPILKRFLNLSIAESTNLKYDPKNSALKQLKDLYGKSEEYKKFQESYYGGKSMEFLGKIRKIRDGLPNQLIDFMSLKNVMQEFVHGKAGTNQHFFFEDNLYGRNSDNKIFDPNYKVFDLVGNIFNLIPGIDTVNHLEYLYGQTFVKKNALINDGRNKQRLQQEAEVKSLISMADFSYLAKMRNKPYAEIEKELAGMVNNYSLRKGLTAEQKAKYQSALLRDGNTFVDMLTTSNFTITDKETGIKTTTSKVRVQPYFGSVKLTDKEIESIRADFAKLPWGVRMNLAFYTIVNYGTSTSLKAGGWFNLIDVNTRVQLAQLEYTSPENAAMSLLMYSRLEDNVRNYSSFKDGVEKDEESGLQNKQVLKNVYTLFKEEKSSDYVQTTDQVKTTFKTLLQILKEGSEEANKITTTMAMYMNRLGIKTKEELIAALEKIEQITTKIRYQFNSYDEGTSVAMQDPEMFAFMFEHFKSIYPDIQVFNNVEDFLDFIYKTTKKRESVDIRAIGATLANAVYLNPDTAQQDTMFHEMSHIYWDALPDSNPVKKKMRLLYGWNSSMDQRQTDDIDELIVSDIGITGTNQVELRFKGSRLKLFLDYLKEFWNEVKSVFGSLNDKQQAEIYSTQRIIADQIWNGGINQSQIALDNAMRYQLGSWAGSFFSKDILHFRKNDMPFSTPGSLDNYLGEDNKDSYEEAINTVENIIEQIELNELDFVQVVHDNPLVFTGFDGMLYYKSPDGKVIRMGKGFEYVKKEKSVRDIMLQEERNSVRHAAIANMITQAANRQPLQNFEMDDETVLLGDLFEDPEATFAQIKTIVENTILDEGFQSFEVGKVVYDDKSRHIVQMDIVGQINAQGDQVIVKFVPTMSAFNNEAGGLSDTYTRESGHFRNGSPLDKLPNSLEQKIKNAMFQFANLYNRMAAQEATGKKVTRVVVVPLLMTEKGIQLTNLSVEKEINYSYTSADKVLTDELIQFIENEKRHKYSMNAIYDQEQIDQTLAGLTGYERESKMKEINAAQFLELFAAQVGDKISTWTISKYAKLGIGKFIGLAQSLHGWGEFDIISRFGQNRNNAKDHNFTLKNVFKRRTNADGSERGSLIYGSPGWGKSFVSLYHKLIYDSDTILESNLLKNYLNENSLEIKNLRAFSDAHPITSYQSGKFFGVTLADGYTFDKLLGDYHLKNISLSLFAFRLSSMVFEYRLMAAKEIAGVPSTKATSKEDMRIATSEMESVGVSMIRLNTPYEDLMSKVEDALSKGYHILSSTLMRTGYEHLIDMKYDSVFLLRDDVGKKQGYKMMQYRTMSHERKNVIAPSDQKWNAQRYLLENERFNAHEDLHYTDKFATDDLFKQPFHSHKEKISSLKAVYAIQALGIKKQAYIDKVKKGLGESIVDPDRTKALENINLTMEQFILDQWNAQDHLQQNEYGATELTYKMLVDIIKKSGLNGTPYGLLGLNNTSSPGEFTEEEVLQMFVKNISKAEMLWGELGTIESFAKRFDFTSGKTEEERIFIHNSLKDLYDRITTLDAFNAQGLRDIVEAQMTINRTLEAVQQETNDGGNIRPNTQILAQMLRDPDMKWITGSEWEKIMFAGRDFAGLFKPKGKFGDKMRLDRLIDKHNILLQTMTLNSQVTHNTIVEESKEMTMKLTSLSVEMNQNDWDTITYRYGDDTDTDVVKSMYGRTAYVSRDRAIELRNTGQISELAFTYLELLRQYFDTYDFKFHKQLLRYGNEVPMFMPDVIAQLEPLNMQDFATQNSEFARLVNSTYGVDIAGSSNRNFRRKLYAAMNVSSEDSFVLQFSAAEKEDPDNKVSKYDGLTFAEAKRDLFDPLTTNTKELLEQSIERIEGLRELASEGAIKKFVKKTRVLHVSGAFNKGIILRTKMIHEANIMYLNSLISNYHTSNLAPYAQFVEDRYRQTKRTNKNNQTEDNYMLDYITKYIDERVFKHTPEDMVQVRKTTRYIGMLVSSNGLGLNLKGAAGNLTAGQLQNFFVAPNQYKTGLLRANSFDRSKSLHKAIGIMRNSNVGMVVDDVTFKRSEVYFEKAMRVSFYLTTKVEDINQGLLFLGSLTQAELDMYDNDGKPIDPNVKISHYRSIQIENLLRRVHGDYGHNRPLYGSDPWLMEIARFKMGWWQTLIQDTWGGTSVDFFGQEYRALRQTVHNSLSRVAVRKGSLLGINKNSNDRKVALLEKVLAPKKLDELRYHLFDTFEASVKNAYDGLEHRSLYELNTMELNVPQPDGTTKKQYITITDSDKLSTKAKMVLELFIDEREHKNYLVADRVDNENWTRMYKMLGVNLIGFVVTGMAFYTVAGLLTGGGGEPDRKGALTWRQYWMALAYGWKHEGLWGYAKNVWAPKAGFNTADYAGKKLTNFSSLSQGGWDALNTARRTQNFSKQIVMDVLMPYNAQAIWKLGDLNSTALMGTASYMVQTLGSVLADGVSIAQGKGVRHFDMYNVQKGITTEMGVTAYYLRKSLPVKFLFDFANTGVRADVKIDTKDVSSFVHSLWYSGSNVLFTNPNKKEYEESQIFVKSQANMKSMYGLAIGMGLIEEQDIPELYEQVYDMTRMKYYNNPEYMRNTLMEDVNTDKVKGDKLIKGEKENLWRNIQKYKKTIE